MSCPLVNKCVHCDTRLDRCLWHNFACPTVPKCEHCGVRTDIPEHAPHLYNCPTVPKCEHCGVRTDIQERVPHLYNCPSIINQIEEHRRALQIIATGTCGEDNRISRMERIGAFINRIWYVPESEHNLVNREVPDFSHLSTTNSQEECPICREEGADMRTTCGHHFHSQCLTEWCKRYSNCPLCRNQRFY